MTYGTYDMPILRAFSIYIAWHRIAPWSPAVQVARSLPQCWVPTNGPERWRFWRWLCWPKNIGKFYFCLVIFKQKHTTTIAYHGISHVSVWTTTFTVTCKNTNICIYIYTFLTSQCIIWTCMKLYFNGFQCISRIRKNSKPTQPGDHPRISEIWTPIPW